MAWPNFSRGWFRVCCYIKNPKEERIPSGGKIITICPKFQPQTKWPACMGVRCA